MRNILYQRNNKYSILAKTAGLVLSAALTIGMAAPGTATHSVETAATKEVYPQGKTQMLQ